jgi:hypothetical protein
MGVASIGVVLKLIYGKILTLIDKLLGRETHGFLYQI